MVNNNRDKVIHLNDVMQELQPTRTDLEKRQGLFKYQCAGLKTEVYNYSSGAMKCQIINLAGRHLSICFWNF